jgi:membrane associated rhomboid family serine protease
MMARNRWTVTNAIAALTALAWLIAVLMGESDYAAAAMGFIPARLSGAVAPWPAVPAAMTPLTATLVHGGPLHLVLNMVILLWCGTLVERALGKTSLIVLYLVGAFASAAAQWLSDPNGIIPMVGASGAISAVIGAYSLSYGRAKQVTSSARLNRWINIAWLMAAWVVIQAMVGWVAGGQGYLLATPAHIGGFLAGLLLQRPLLLWQYRKA